MKNFDIISMVQSGTLGITGFDLDAANSYKVFKFRNALQKAFKKIQELEESMLKDFGITDPNGLDARVKELRGKNTLTEEEKTELDELQAKIKKFNETRMEMLNEDAVLENVKTMPYEQWYKLRKENHPSDPNTPDPLNNYIEGLLEGILWVAPEEE